VEILTVGETSGGKAQFFERDFAGRRWYPELPELKWSVIFVDMLGYERYLVSKGAHPLE
jgi:hypothetical protein